MLDKKDQNDPTKFEEPMMAVFVKCKRKRYIIIIIMGKSKWWVGLTKAGEHVMKSIFEKQLCSGICVRKSI